MNKGLPYSIGLPSSQAPNGHVLPLRILDWKSERTTASTDITLFSRLYECQRTFGTSVEPWIYPLPFMVYNIQPIRIKTLQLLMNREERTREHLCFIFLHFQRSGVSSAGPIGTNGGNIRISLCLWERITALLLVTESRIWYFLLPRYSDIQDVGMINKTTDVKFIFLKTLLVRQKLHSFVDRAIVKPYG
jgi:hypothetical protein